MLTKAHLCFRAFIAIVAAGFLSAGVSTLRADDFLDTFRVGTTVYSNVTVMTKTSTDIFFKHAFGFGNAKVREVDRSTLGKLGYQLPPEDGETKSVLDESAQKVLESAAVTNLVADPRVQQMQALVNERLGDVLEFLTPQVIYGLVAGVIGLYLFVCFCFRQICVKTGQTASPLVWIPVLQQLPLFRAAGMSAWWLLTAFLPPVWPLIQIWWAFRIAQARGKSWIVGLLLILPITNLLAFLYLAFSGTGTSEPAPTGHVISLGGPPRRAAA